MRTVEFIDVSDDPTWGNVKMVEIIRFDGKIAVIVNHRDHIGDTNKMILKGG